MPFITHPTTRRRLRRQRAKARLDWYLFKKGFIHLPKSRLEKLYHCLNSHHSRDPVFLRRIGRFSQMAESRDPWKCASCKKIAKASSQFCAHCGQHWSEVWDVHYNQHSSQWNYAASGGTPRSPRASREQWPERPARERSGSRRTRNQGRAQRSRNSKGDGKGKSKPEAGKGSLAGKNAAASQRSATPALSLEEVWAPPSAPPAAVAPPPPQQPESAQLKGLLTALKKVSADLPADVQAAMQKFQVDDSKQLTKQLHSAVSQLGNSKKSLADLMNARANLHQSWSSFLDAAITRWQRYAEDFTQQDKDLATQIEKANETMKVCKDHFKSLQALEGQATVEVTEVISDDELSAQPSKVDVHMKMMQDSLQALKGGMEEELRGSKRPRTAEITENKESEPPGVSAASLCA